MRDRVDVAVAVATPPPAPISPTNDCAVTAGVTTSPIVAKDGLVEKSKAYLSGSSAASLASNLYGSNFPASLILFLLSRNSSSTATCAAYAGSEATLFLSIREIPTVLICFSISLNDTAC